MNLGIGATSESVCLFQDSVCPDAIPLLQKEFGGRFGLEITSDWHDPTDGINLARMRSVNQEDEMLYWQLPMN